MTKQERITGIFLIVLGIAVTQYAVAELKLGTIQEPGPGFFPSICGAGIVILSVMWLIASRKVIANYQPLWENGQLVAPVLATVLITVYTALMDVIGYLLSTFVFLIAWEFLIEHETWLKTGIIAAVGTVAMFTLFNYLLGVPLPEGLLF